MPIRNILPQGAVIALIVLIVSAAVARADETIELSPPAPFDGARPVPITDGGKPIRALFG